MSARLASSLFVVLLLTSALFASFSLIAIPPARAAVIVGGLSLSLSYGRAGDSVILTGSGWTDPADDGLCTLTSNPSGLFGSTSCSIASGILSGAFTVSSGARGGADPTTHIGGVTYTVMAKRHTNTASASPFYVEPVITVSPVSGSPQVGSGSPPGGAAATTMTVTGTGFNPVDTGCTYTPSAGLIISSPTCHVTSSTGALTGSFKIGIGSISGTHTVLATGNVALDPSSTTPSFDVVGNIAVNPTSGSLGSTIGVFGAGFSSTLDACGVGVSITGLPVGATSCTKNTDGTFAGQFTVAAVVSGTYLITYTDNDAGGSAYATFTVTGGPVIALSPNTGHTGTVVTVSGSGFSSGDTSVSIASSGLFLPSPMTCAVSGGKIAAGCTFTVNSLAAGLPLPTGYVVTATGNVANDPSQANFLLTATLTLTPSVGSAGTSVTMSGSGYIAGPSTCTTFTSSTPAIKLFGPGPNANVAICSIDGNGILTGSFTVDTVGPAPFGTYTVTISDLLEVPQTTVTAGFAVALPMISFSPDHGSSGDTITISGSGFSSADTTCSLSGGTNVFTALTCSISGGVVTGSFKVPGAGTPAQSGAPMTLTGNSMDSAQATFNVVPKITLTPNPAHLGSIVTVTGTNFLTPGAGNCAITGASVLAGSDTCNVATGVDYTLVSSSFTVDPTFSGASDTITVTDTGDPTVAATATLNIAVPHVVLTPSSGTVGASISVTGTGFSAADSCPTSKIEGTPVDSTPVGCSSVSAGTISGSFIVKAGTAPGTYTVTLTGTSLDVGDASFTVVPAMTLTPSSGGAGTTVLASGSNFAPGDSGCTIQSSPAGLISNPICTVAGGSMSGSFTVASDASGPYSVTVTGTSGDVATISFNAPGGRTLTLTPDSGQVGTVVVASGSNFAGTSCVLSSSPGGLFTSSSCAISAGTLSGGFTVGSGASGSYTLTATSNLGSTDSASASFTVTVGPPATFSVDPTSGLGGTVVVVSGENYAGTSCSLSSTPSGLFSSTPTCSISGGTLAGSFTVATGASAGGYTVRVTTNVPSDTIIAQFTIPTPTFTLTPASSVVGTNIVASGSNYAGTTCSLSSTPSGLFTSSTCSISSGALSGGFTVASGASLGGYTVTVMTNVAGETKTAPFAVNSPGPQTFVLSPSSGAAGTSVSGSGQNYVGTTCSLSSTPSGLFTSSSCSITAGTLSGSFTVASGASGSYAVTVTTNTGETKGASFAVTGPLTFTLTPASGVVGTVVTATGLNFAGSTCTLDAAPSSFFASSTCSISSGGLTGIFTVDSGAVPSTVYTVTVTTNAGEMKSATFTVRSPTTFVLTPASAGRSTGVSISGTDYVGTTCALSAAPSGLFTSSSCSISAGHLSGGFTIASGASVGSYFVTVSTNQGEQLSAPFTVTSGTGTAPGTMCIIATATFGSEAAPAVQFLRNFRDGLVLHTSAGSAFMTVFNAWYYSFSPNVASFISSHDPIRAPIRVILYPLLGILELGQFTYSALSVAPEFAIVVTGLVASSLIGLVYLTLPALVGIRTLRKRRAIARVSIAKISTASLATALLLIAVGELAGSFVLLAIGSSVLVLTCIISVPVLLALAILRTNP